MRGLIAPVGAIVVVATAIAVLAWAPWDARERERELAWVEAYAAWSAGVEADLRRGRTVTPEACRRRFDETLEPAPSQRLEDAARVARRRCGITSNEDEWARSRWDVLGELVDAHTASAQTRREPALSRIAGRIARRPATVHCWIEGEWEALAEQYAAFEEDELRPIGVADPERGRIDLAPEGCEQLRLFARGELPPPLSGENLRLAEALVLLAHEAEHLRVPDASEAEVECYALQRVRGLARSAGLGPARQDELAGLALDYSYPYLPPDYQTRRCRDGGPLDLSPESPLWP